MSLTLPHTSNNHNTTSSSKEEEEEEGNRTVGVVVGMGVETQEEGMRHSSRPLMVVGLRTQI
jgi:hypothetical protein